MFREVKGRYIWNGYLKLTITPHWTGTEGLFRTTERQIVIGLVLGEQVPGGKNGQEGGKGDGRFWVIEPRSRFEASVTA
jgi:hypothetical protein